MPWLIGIDEAGYGPNLGPLVMTSVACRVPGERIDADLWQVLRAAVRRFSDPADGRLLIEDSKLVYSPASGLLDLETGVLATYPWRPGEELILRRYLEWVCPAGPADLCGEAWYCGTSPIPVVADPAVFCAAARSLADASATGEVIWGPARSVVVCPARFNRLLDQWETKGAVLAHALAELLDNIRTLGDGSEPLWFTVDKHGGRNHYGPMLQHALPDGMVIVHEEGSRYSLYSVLGLGREVRLTFKPRADAEHFCVALASMLSKYLRELLMREFNRFWREQVPGLKPTAGYPGDAARFYRQIRPAARRLGIPRSALWRRR